MVCYFDASTRHTAHRQTTKAFQQEFVVLTCPEFSFVSPSTLLNCPDPPEYFHPPIVSPGRRWLSLRLFLEPHSYFQWGPGHTEGGSSKVVCCFAPSALSPMHVEPNLFNCHPSPEVLPESFNDDFSMPLCHVSPLGTYPDYLHALSDWEALLLIVVCLPHLHRLATRWVVGRSGMEV